VSVPVRTPIAQRHRGIVSKHPFNRRVQKLRVALPDNACVSQRLDYLVEQPAIRAPDIAMAVSSSAGV
jgi:hypothetical protein